MVQGVKIITNTEVDDGNHIDERRPDEELKKTERRLKGNVSDT